jgi:uncharacterized protein (DUF1501 family)
MASRNPSPSRRGLLKAGLAAGGTLLFSRGARSASLAIRQGGMPTPVPGENVLVVLELAGGNDGLNTIVPYADDLYHAARAKLRVPASEVLAIDDYRGFHPLLANLRRYWDAGRMAIVEGAGYASPNRSHFASFDIWRAADRRGRLVPDGWLGRTLEALYGDDTDPNRAFHIGGTLPYSLKSRVHIASCFESPGSYRRLRGDDEVAALSGSSGAQVLAQVQGVFDAAHGSSKAVRTATAAYEPKAEYPATPLAQALRTAAALIQGGLGVRIVNVSHDGFDTHVHQESTHRELLSSWDGALSAFLDDLAGTPGGDRTTVLVYSEFGRRVAENASGGTDHGCAGPMFLFGPKVNGGLYGKHPSLAELDDGDLIYTTDFRSVYATLLERWFHVEPTRVLDEVYPVLPLLS